MEEFKKWPSIVCVIDEFQAFIRRLTAEKQNKNAHMIIVDLLERARKVKIHLVLVTQNASKGNIKIGTTNLGASIAFKCKTRYDSEAIIESSDAVDLSAKGAMYIKCYLYDGLKRVQGSYMQEIEIIDMLEKMEFNQECREGHYDEVKFVPSLSTKSDADVLNSDIHILEDTSDELLDQIIILALKKNKISNNIIKNSFEMGYDRANKYLDQLEKEGIISKLKEGTKLSRRVNVDRGKEFLINHGYTENAKEGTFIKVEQISGIQSEINLAQEQSVESVVEESDVSELVENVSVNTSKKQRKKIIIQSPKRAKNITENHDRTKRRPAH